MNVRVHNIMALLVTGVYQSTQYHWRYWLLEYVRVQNIIALLVIRVCECQSTEYHGTTGYWSMSEYRCGASGVPW